MRQTWPPSQRGKAAEHRNSLAGEVAIWLAQRTIDDDYVVLTPGIAASVENNQGGGRAVDYVL